jgi:hypothetical protein
MGMDGINLAAQTPSDVFLAKLDATGHAVWVNSFTDAYGTGSQQGTEVKLGQDGSVTTTGWYTGAVDLGAGPLDSQGDSKRYVAQFDGTGQLVWQLDFVDDGEELETRVAVNPVSDVFVASQYTGTTHVLGPVFTSQGSTDLFLGKYTSH